MRSTPPRSSDSAYFKHKVVIITGGSAGLGLALARSFLSACAKVIVVARDAEKLERAATQLGSDSTSIRTIAADVTVDDDVARVFETVGREFGRLDVLVNNVGSSQRGMASQTSPQQFQELWEVNFLSAVRCTRAALPLLAASRGHLVNIGSLSSKVATPVLGAYPASKFPLAAYSQQLRLELTDQGIHVLLVCPGPIRRDDSGSRYAEQADGMSKAASRPGGGAKLNAIDAEWLSGRILQACRKRQPELIVPGKVRLLFALGQLWPTIGDWILRKKTS